MKVWVVYCRYESLAGIFSTLEKAQAYAFKLGDRDIRGVSVSEFTLDEEGLDK